MVGEAGTVVQCSVQVEWAVEWAAGVVAWSPFAVVGQPPPLATAGVSVAGWESVGGRAGVVRGGEGGGGVQGGEGGRARGHGRTPGTAPPPPPPPTPSRTCSSSRVFTNSRIASMVLILPADSALSMFDIVGVGFGRPRRSAGSYTAW